jgi:putative DNA primase/helicase
MELLAGDGMEILKYLYNEGLEIPYSSRKKIPDYISSAKTEKFLGCATRTGWHSSQTFVLPDSVIGDDGVWFQSDKKIAAYGKAGRMENWQELVAAQACGNPFLMFCLSFAFCGPLLGRLGFDGVGVHLYGDTTVGKTTVLTAGGSVWGGRGYARSWRSTANGMEGIGVQHSDTLLVLDEIAEINPMEMDEVAYFLINGHGKNRADRHGQAKAAARWRVPVLSSGEQSIRTKLAAGGIPSKAGQRLRILDIPVSGKYGLFDELHEFKDGAAFADALRCAAHQHFGYAGPAFVEAIIKRGVSDLAEGYEDFLKQFGDLDRQQQRGARVFALAALAGELAANARVTPWDKTEAFEAVFYVFKRWQEARDASSLGSEHCEILRAIKDFIERHGESRFSDLNPKTEGPIIRDRAGYWEQNRDDSITSSRFMIRNRLSSGFQEFVGQAPFVETGVPGG